MSHFKFKSLAFYTVAIGAVLLLFNVVTAYGEAKLKAPAPIDGRYRLSAQIPKCVKSNALVLTIQQSGIYLNGSLLPANANAQQASGEKKFSLNGLLRNQQLSLSGTVPSSSVCNNLVPQAQTSAPPNNRSSTVSIQSQVKGETLQGKITLSGILEGIDFTAQREAPVEKSATNRQSAKPQSGADERWLLRPLIVAQSTPAPTQNIPPLPSTLPPASFDSQQPGFVSVPPLQPQGQVAPGQSRSKTPTASSTQPTSRVSEPYTAPVIDFGQPLPKATP